MAPLIKAVAKHDFMPEPLGDPLRTLGGVYRLSYKILGIVLFIGFVVLYATSSDLSKWGIARVIILWCMVFGTFSIFTFPFLIFVGSGPSG